MAVVVEIGAQREDLPDAGVGGGYSVGGRGTTRAGAVEPPVLVKKGLSFGVVLESAADEGRGC